MCDLDFGGCYNVNMTPDVELLRDYARTKSEEAFAELVRRHVNLVYSAALRQVGGDTHLAQDVAQTVFTDLARKAASLCRRESLTGWLYTSAHFAAANIVRGEHRRRDREEQFMREPIQDNATAADWEKLRPMLDSVMHELKETDREAVLLRYFENRPFAEVGARLRVNENTARMRVERALEKLRGLLAKRGIATGAALASVISSNAVQMAPAALPGNLTTAVLSGTGFGSFTFFQTMHMAKLKLGLGALATAGVIAALVVQLEAQRTLRAENETLSVQIAQLKADNADLSSQIAANANSLAIQKDQSDELLKLRAEVTQLRPMKAAPAMATSPATNNLHAGNKTEIEARVRFVSLPTQMMPGFGEGWTAAGPDTSVLSEQQFAAVAATLRNNDVNLLRESEITTLSGREAQLNDIVPKDHSAANVEFGNVLDMVPYISSDSSTLTLNLAAKLIQLTGDPSNPGVVTTQVSNQVSLVPGQTVVLKADLPRGAWLHRGGDNSVWPTSPDEPNELLVFVTPKLVESKGAEGQASADPALQDAANQKQTEAKYGVLALLMFAANNAKQYPATLNQAASYIQNDQMNAVESNFDFINPGSTTNVVNPADTILLKEKEPWQNGNGNWVKVYGFADGHVEIHGDSSGNFDEFENQHTISAMVNP
ncbi:MAG TPA: sigma-70 family RNA polymerase sigma factor [Verrucomicrobiae bacterium]|nr:sigma-70 family RNA polymerase sigma factor [Verrucomicrobiae bacterium]